MKSDDYQSKNKNTEKIDTGKKNRTYCQYPTYKAVHIQSFITQKGQLNTVVFSKTKEL